MGSYLQKVLSIQDDDEMRIEQEKLYTQLWSELNIRIGCLKWTLINLDRDSTKSHDILADHTKEISDTLQTISDNKLDTRRKVTNPNYSYYDLPNPIHALLSVGRLMSVQIPSEVVENLISAGFDMNQKDYVNETCLYKAIKYHHYNIVRLLIKYEAACCDANGEERPIILLASHPNVPLDLFDLLATPCNLEAALCNAAANGCIKPALHLIKLGARVDGLNSYGRLPVDYFAGQFTRYHLQDGGNLKQVDDDQIFNDLFMNLLPSRPQGVNILRVICTFLNRTYTKSINNVNEMLHQLVERLDLVQPLNLTIKVDSYNYIIHLKANGVVILSGAVMHSSCQTVYLCCLILSELQLDVIAPPDISPLPQLALSTETMAYAEATDDLLKAFHQQHNVKSLLRHCILRIRTSMRSLDSNSFMNLPLPTYIQRLLTLRDISEKICEEWMAVE